MKTNKLLEYFGVKNYKELEEFVLNNGDDERVKELIEVIDEINNVKNGNKGDLGSGGGNK